MNDFDTLILSPENQELRIEVGEDGKTRVHGLAVPYEKLSADVGGFRESFLPGAFSDTLLENREVFADIEHDGSKRLARRSKGSLQFQDGTDGLRFTLTLPDTTLGKDTAEEVRSGLLDGVSVAFKPVEQTWSGKGKETVRKVSKAILRAITLTDRPAYAQTIGTLTMRSLDEHQKAEEEAAKPPETPPETPIEVLRMQCDLAIAENQA